MVLLIFSIEDHVQNKLFLSVFLLPFPVHHSPSYKPHGIFFSSPYSYIEGQKSLPTYNLPKDGNGKLSLAQHTVNLPAFPSGPCFFHSRFPICPSLFVDHGASSSGIYWMGREPSLCLLGSLQGKRFRCNL